MIPQTLQANPSLDRWVSFLPGGRVRLAFGKIEYGQGAMTALAQIGAEELDVDMARLDVVAGDTEVAPDEGLTVGSMSLTASGPSVRAACAEVAALFRTKAAEALGCDPAELSIRDGAFLRGGAPTGHDYWSLAGEVSLARAPTGEAPPKPISEHRLVGRSQPRLDLPAKVFGAGFIHDLKPAGLRHARVLRQPGPKASLATLDEAAFRRAAGENVDLVRADDFLAVVSDDETAAARALVALERLARWDGLRDIPAAHGEAQGLADFPASDFEAGEPAAPSNRLHSATYSRPYISHGSMAPSCGLARYADGRLEVWSHTQGVYALRGLIARALGLTPEAIVVHYAMGAGVYGHNGADDAAADAAAIAVLRPGETIRVLWRREDEFGYEPLGPAMQIEVSAELDDAGRPTHWTSEILSGSHVGRGRLLIEDALPAPELTVGAPASDPAALIARFSGSRLNAAPSYEVGPTRIVEHTVFATPVRTSSLRGLGGPINIYANECFVDELAERAGVDPVAYRLAMSEDPRARAVIARCAEMAGWSGRGPGGSGRGLGFAYARHRGMGGYVACAAEVEVETEVRVLKMWCAADCGLIVNPDGARNQLEGGMIMAVSWALKEQVRIEGPGVASTTWDDYPILRFDEVPAVEIELMPAKDDPMGLGEVSSGPALGAVGNAVAHALGAQVRDMPFTRERIDAALLADPAAG